MWQITYYIDDRDTRSIWTNDISDVFSKLLESLRLVVEDDEEFNWKYSIYNPDSLNNFITSEEYAIISNFINNANFGDRLTITCMQRCYFGTIIKINNCYNNKEIVSEEDLLWWINRKKK